MVLSAVYVVRFYHNDTKITTQGVHFESNNSCVKDVDLFEIC